MSNWFTVERIDNDTYAVSEYGHWEQTHCYLLCGAERAALVDTGLGVANIKRVVDALTELPVTVLTTHVHWDHIGGHGYFTDFAVHESEVEWITGHFPLLLPAVKRALAFEPCAFPDGFCLDDYHIFSGTPTRVLRGGELLDLGKRTLQVIHTPGHSPGHCCFYEPERARLYSGDLIYRGCLDAFYPGTDPLAFMRSVEKVQALGAKEILPGHHQLELPADLTDRIAAAFHELHRQNKLRQGCGVFDFGEFQIRL